MALILAQHHRDCQALGPSVAIRLASALGRVAAPGGIRLRPRGVGRPSTSVNLKCMDALQERILRSLDSCRAEDLARLDEYYVTRLCSQDATRAIIVRMANAEIGFREATKQHQPLMVQLAASVLRELPEGFRWGLPRIARDYLEELRVLGLKDTAPWALDPVGAARARLQALRAEAY